MRMQGGIERYDRVQVIFHWLIAAIILFMLGLGLYMVGLPKQSALPPGQESVRAFYFLLHKSVGLTVAMLIILRIVWRLTHKAPPLPDSIPKWQQRASGAVHAPLYVLMVLVPLTGYLQSMYSKYDTHFWGLLLPRLAQADSAMRENFSTAHGVLAYIMMAVLVVHIVAAFKHKLSGNGMGKRMSL